ncbi:MAG: hypothetical protein CFH34_01698 [Alphaproteobacteria bacterium MarineAlpha9_Bin4]|nr:hypothetical protein [Pelagibacterales bacterium]PPR24761.1 MAG: hypothetical protein CFH34_01698 [Alphaproteobacteria bacterium MarineAlpha9_Bin4]
MLPDLILKLLSAIILSLCLIFPVYKFILMMSARKYSLEEYNAIKSKVKKKSLILSILITIVFSLVYCLQVL